MISKYRIALIIPARNESESIARVISCIPEPVDRIIVVDNGSTDGTGDIARALGIRVVRENRLGYGRACLAGIESLKNDPPDIVAFADGDGSDNHEELIELLIPIVRDNLDMVLARRVPRTISALSFQQRTGNGLATRLIGFFWGCYFQDLGPMRAIRWDALEKLDMKDCNYGWTVEMQIKAIRQTLKIREIPIAYLPRFAGKSKVSRTFSGVIKAGTKILWIVFREAWKDRQIIFKKWKRTGEDEYH
jgi:glycosyltransferase involved in cell wall biosynthesis